VTWAIAIQIFAALGGIAGISSFINLMISRKKVSADTADIEQNRNDKMIKNLEGDNKNLRDEIRLAKTEVNEVRSANERLHDQMEILEWESVETRRLVISLLNWSREAYELCKINNIPIRQPPSEGMIRKRPE
jgi:hypothetical protein